MRICLVSAPTLTDLDSGLARDSAAVHQALQELPLGILALAAMLEHAGFDPHVVDLNVWEYEHAFGRACRTGFSAVAADRLASLNADVIGFGTICSSYPLTLRIAETVKRFRPASTVLLGGPQASVVDGTTLRHCPFVDFILRGEADRSIVEFATRLSSGAGVENVSGLTHRRQGQPCRNPDAPVVLELDELPLPAFHRHPTMGPRHSIPLELGRGCPFACTFCSTNDFFRRRYRLKSPARLLREMDELAARYSATYFDLTHDMFTVDRRRVVSFCEAMLASGRGHRWGCSARTDFVDEELIELMARAGCVSVFFGIESGSARLQKVIGKGLDLDEARRSVRMTGEHGMSTTASLIVGFFEEEQADLRATLGFIGEVLRHEKVRAHLHLLAPLAGTPVEAQFRGSLLLEEIPSTQSLSGWSQEPEERALIARFPEMFPNFYAVPTPHLDRGYLHELREFFVRTMFRFRWLLVAWHDRCGDLLSLFDEWRSWSQAERAMPCGLELRRYYSSWEFDQDFVRFLASRPAAARDDFEEVLLGFEEALVTALRRSARACGRTIPATEIHADHHVALAPQAHVLDVPGDVVRVVELLRDTQRADDKSVRRETTVVTRTTADGEGDVEVVTLKPLAIQFLRLCADGGRVGDVLARFASLCDPACVVPPHRFAAHALHHFLRERLVQVCADPEADQERTAHVLSNSA